MATQTVDDPTGSDWGQPPFDPRISSLAMLQPNSQSSSGGIQRGYIKQAGGSAQAAVNPRTVYFLYNPSSVSVSHAIALTDPAMDPSLRSALDDGSLVGPTGATVSFSLLFDRTYEVSDPANFGNRLGEKGVGVDIEALYALTGILQLQPLNAGVTPATPTVNDSTNAGKADTIAKQFVTELNGEQPAGGSVFTIQDILNGTTKGPNGVNRTDADDLAKAILEQRLRAAGLALTDLPPNPDNTNVVSGSTPSTPPGWPFVSSAGSFGNNQQFGFMTVLPVVVVFGRQRVSWSPTLEYYGYISSMDIEYAHWTQNMVPSRCAVSITMTLLSTSVDKMTALAVG